MSPTRAVLLAFGVVFCMFAAAFCGVYAMELCVWLWFGVPPFAALMVAGIVVCERLDGVTSNPYRVIVEERAALARFEEDAVKERRRNAEALTLADWRWLEEQAAEAHPYDKPREALGTVLTPWCPSAAWLMVQAEAREKVTRTTESDEMRRARLYCAERGLSTDWADLLVASGESGDVLLPVGPLTAQALRHAPKVVGGSA